MDSGKIFVYTDGACKGNGLNAGPARRGCPGGWGWVEYSESGELGSALSKLEFCDYGGEMRTTNNRMELTAIIEFLKDAPVGMDYLIHSDSQYCLRGLVDGHQQNGVVGGSLRTPGVYSGWMRGWIAKNFKDIKNVEHWKNMDSLIQRHLRAKTKLEFRYVKGHSGDAGNDRADELANLGVPKM